MERVIAVQDNDFHWYVIPYFLKEDFFRELEEGEEDEYDMFIAKYSQYMTGGDLNLVQLYAEI